MFKLFRKELLFCSVPFRRIVVHGRNALRPAGDAIMCCWLKTPPIGNIRDQSVEEVWNGQDAQEIRHTILDGSFKYCDRDACPYLQTVTYDVRKRGKVKDKELKKAIKSELTILPHGPREIICCYDKSCNLACPSCRTKVIVESENREEILAIQSKLEKEALKDVHVLTISGTGDPFGSPFYRQWLQTMNRWKMPHLSRILLHTNAQLWTPKMWDTIPREIQELVKRAEISIDAATAKTYSINRRGGSFENLLNNLEFISTLRTNGPLRYLKLSMVVQSNNFREMHDFIHLGKRYSADVVYFGKIRNWGTFPEEEYKDRAIHLPDHPFYREFIALIKKDIFRDPVVHMGNLSVLR
jgi:MoaA/NifB/PqqE/SkfB family radical SAM enzyme